MKKQKFISVAKNVINLEIKALQLLKKNINTSFNDAVIQIAKCQSKVILCGVGKSGLIASKIAATLSSVGTPSFSLSAGDSSHGDLGSISKKDSLLYKASDIKLLIPQVIESGSGIVPTSSTTVQLALGDALAISAMQYKKFGRLDFKKIHPAGSLGSQLRTAEDIMLTGNKIPFVNDKLNMKSALSILGKKKLGILIVQNKQKKTIGIITDGEIRRYNEKNSNLHEKNVKQIMTKNPISVEKDILAAKALSLMNSKKITSLCVYDKKNKFKTIGVLHVHTILKSNIS